MHYNHIFCLCQEGKAKILFEKIFGAVSKKMSCTAQQYGEHTCKNNVYSILRRYGCISIEESRRCRALTRSGKDACNDIWQADLKGGFRMEDGNYGCPLTIPDDRGTL